MRLQMKITNSFLLKIHLLLTGSSKIKNISFISLLTLAAFSPLKADSVQLENGYYYGSTLKDSVVVSVSENKITINFNDGSTYNFDRKSKTDYYKKNISSDGETLIQIMDNENFKILGNQSSETKAPYSKYTLYKKPGFLNKIIAALVTSALLFLSLIHI